MYDNDDVLQNSLHIQNVIIEYVYAQDRTPNFNISWLISLTILQSQSKFDENVIFDVNQIQMQWSLQHLHMAQPWHLQN